MHSGEFAWFIPLLEGIGREESDWEREREREREREMNTTLWADDWALHYSVQVMVHEPGKIPDDDHVISVEPGKELRLGIERNKVWLQMQSFHIAMQYCISLNNFLESKWVK